MAEDIAVAMALRERIRAKRAQVDRWLAKARPRKRRLVNTTLIGGSLSALLTAGPALGGKPFSEWLTAMLGTASPSWRLLCGAAAVASVAAAVATQVLKSHGLEDELSKAQICSAKLEVLELSLGAGQMDEKQALAEYIRCIESVAFLQGD